MTSPQPYSDGDFNQIIVELYKKTQLPLKASQLVTRYIESVFKTRQELPNCEHDTTFELIQNMNYEAVSQQIRNLRLSLLELWRDRIIEQITIENCLPLLSVKLLDNKVTQQFIDSLPEIFDFSESFKEENRQISKCFDDLQMLFLKIAENIMGYYELKDLFNSKIQAQIDKIRRDLTHFCEEYFYYFNVGLEKHLKQAVKNKPFEVPKVPQMQRIVSSFNKYQDQVTHQIGVSKWLVPANALKQEMANEQLNIKNQISKTFHNKNDFELKVKPKLYLLVGKNEAKPNFDFLNSTLKQELINIVNQVLHNISATPQAKQNTRLRLSPLLDLNVQSEPTTSQTKKPFQPKWTPQSEQINLLAIINLFLLVNCNYSCVDRQLLRMAIRYLKNFEFGYSNFKILLALENMDIGTAHNLGDNPTASKIFQAESVHDRTSYNTVTSKLSEQTSTSSATDYVKRLSLPQSNQSILERLRMQDNAYVNKQIQVLMTKINVHKLEKSFKKYPLMEFEKISNPKIRSRVITICISGFTSQDDVKDESWRHLIKEHEGEVYALNWESKTVKEMTEFAWKKIQGLLVNRIFYSVPILNIMTIVNTLIEAYKSNPFHGAFEEAILTGNMLGNLLPEMFPNCLINLIGFSLGTELIKECLKIVKKDGNEGMINKVILIGGVADRTQLKGVLENTPFEVSNFHSDNDQILKVLYRICKPGSQPCGLGPVEGKLVENIDCTRFVEGHGKYRAQFQQICRRIELDDDTHYYYK